MASHRLASPSIKDRFKNWAYSATLSAGFNVKRKLSDSRIIGLLGRLHPVTTSFPLLRLGAIGDGGYLVPDDLNGIVACFSPGVDDIATFEKDLLARGIPCFLADASVEGAPFADPNLHLEKKFLGVVNDETFSTLDSWVDRAHPPAGDLIMQMDIEGNEWPVLLNVSEDTLRRFRIIVIELHNLPHCFDPVAFQLFDTVFDRLGQIFNIVHAHPNNAFPHFRYNDIEIPYFLELTLLRKDRAAATGFVTKLPHPMDSPNVPDLVDVRLPAVLQGGPLNC